MQALPRRHATHRYLFRPHCDLDHVRPSHIAVLGACGGHFLPSVPAWRPARSANPRRAGRSSRNDLPLATRGAFFCR